MLYSEFSNIEIIGISAAIPDNFVKSEDYQNLFGKEAVTNFILVTGIEQTCRAFPHQTVSDFAYHAADDVIKKAKMNKNDIGLLILVTQKPDYRFPSTAYCIHQRLGLDEDCCCFDINLACSGFIYGLHTAISMLEYTDKPYALILTGDTSTRSIAPLDRTMTMLFGEGGTAILIKRSDEKQKKIAFALRTDGKRFNAVVTPAGAYRHPDVPREDNLWSDGIMRSDYDTHMKGMEVFGFSITDVPKLIKEFLNYIEKDIQAYDKVVLHQANKYIIKQIARKLKIADEKLAISIQKYGNTSSNSVPIVLADYYGDKTGSSINVLMSGFGAGLSWAVCDISIPVDSINSLILISEK
jgi:3-oxoacyl-[acyl-carrier-protein] synthase-3